MANKKFLLVMLAIALVFGMTLVGCGGGGGEFTLTGIPSEYNGKYAALVGVNLSNTKLAYAGYQSTNGKDKNKLCRISNGRVSIPVWTVDSSTKIKRYSGSDELYMVTVSIFDSETQATKNPEAPAAIDMFMSVTFSRGKAAKLWKDGISTGEGSYLDKILDLIPKSSR